MRPPQPTLTHLTWLSLPGLLGYGLVNPFLAILTLSKLYQQFPDGGDMTPVDHLCEADHGLKTQGMILGALSLVSQVAFTGKMVFNYLHSDRSKNNQLLIAAQCLTTAMAGAIMNGDNAYEACIYFFHDCERNGQTQVTQPLGLLTYFAVICALLPSAFSKAIAVTDELPKQWNDLALLRHALSPSLSPAALRSRKLTQRLELTDQHQLSQGQLAPYSLARTLIDKTLLIGCAWLSMHYIARSYDEYTAFSVRYFLTNNTNWLARTIDTIATTAGTVSWLYVSVMNTLLIHHHLFNTRALQYVATALNSESPINSHQQGSHIATPLLIFFFSFTNSLPQACLALMQTTLSSDEQHWNAISMVVSNLAFAIIGLDDLLRRMTNPNYLTRQDYYQQIRRRARANEPYDNATPLIECSSSSNEVR